MPREMRAAVFDLDDTLYPYRRFLRSGFAAVAMHLSASHGLDASRLFKRLVAASRHARGAELQACLDEHGLDPALVPDLVARIRGHEPRLRLPRTVGIGLRRLRERGWRLGVLTNGWPDVQARKVAALDLSRHVDVITFAADHGGGKPSPLAFRAVLRQLNVPASAAVFVGDDDVCDIGGAVSAGLRAVRCARWRPVGAQPPVVATATQWSAMPDLIERTLEEACDRDAA